MKIEQMTRYHPQFIDIFCLLRTIWSVAILASAIENKVFIYQVARIFRLTYGLEILKYSWSVKIITPASQFQGRGSEGHPIDELVLDIPEQTGMDLGRIGADAGETLTLSNAFGV